MTTFTSDDREEEYKKILEETQALEKGLEFFKKLKGDNASPPHIVDSGASVMNNEPVAYINVEERKLEWAKPTTWHTPTIAQMDKIPLYIMPNNKPVAWIDPYDLERLPLYDCWVNGEKSKGSIPLYTHLAKTLTDEEIWELSDMVLNNSDVIGFARAILKKAQEK